MKKGGAKRRGVLADETRAPLWLYAISGLLWGLAYLSRSELVLYFGIHFALLAFLHWRRRFGLLPLVLNVAPFLALFAAYNVYADHVAQRDGIAIRKSIYGFYISQGWVDPEPGSGGDIEADGYRYAIKLYGDPVANHESMWRAIQKNPTAFLRRVRLNWQSFSNHYLDRDFFAPWWTGVCGGVLLLLIGLQVPREDRLAIVFLLGCVAASLFVVVYHIDARYLTINIPPLLILTAYGISLAIGWMAKLPRPIATIAILAVLAAVAYPATHHFADMQLKRHDRPSDKSVLAYRALGQHFRSLKLPPPVENREPHIDIRWATPPLHAEDHMLLAYFTQTSWVNAGAEGAFPRGKFYSYRNCESDYLYLPESSLSDKGLLEPWEMVSDCTVPTLGHYYLFARRSARVARAQ